MDVVECKTVLIHLPNESIFYYFFKDIQEFYRPIHAYLSIVLCVLGTIANFCNIVILTRRQMRTPVNMILTAMASCDTVVLFSNLIYTTHYSFVAFQHCHPTHWSYAWALFLIAHAHLSLVAHTSSVWLSVMLALVRYMTLRSRGNMGKTQVTLKHSYYAIALTISSVAILNAPNFLNYKINERRLNETCNILDPKYNDAPAYLPGIADIAMAKHCLVFRLAFWISGFVFKMLPCALLSLFVWLLLRILREVRENRQKLLKTSRTSNATAQVRSNNEPRYSITGVNEKISRNGSLKGRGEKVDRTTHMLLAIVAVMLITEIPQGIMAVLSGMLSEEFRQHVYNNLGDLLDLLSLCGACCSFIIYCSMSGQFRNEFHRVFIPSGIQCTRKSVNYRRGSDPYNTKMTSFFRNDQQVNMKSEEKNGRRQSSLATNDFTQSPIPPSPLPSSKVSDETVHLLDNYENQPSKTSIQEEFQNV